MFGHKVLDFIEDIDRLTTADQIAGAMDRLIAGLGFRALFVGGHRGRPDFRFDDLLFATKCPAEFLSIYGGKNYFHDDPTVKRCRSSPHPFDFNSCDYGGGDGPRVPEIMSLLEDFGLSRGFIVPIHGAEGYEGAIGMVGTKVDLDDGSRSSLNLLSVYVYERLTEIIGGGVKRLPLTLREREVLAWAAQGKSAWEIGEILNIAKRTVDEHVKLAMRKLGAANRTQAVAIALRQRLFDL
jgi:LuxR family quorum sensing-dependent transcriptional regulator